MAVMDEAHLGESPGLTNPALRLALQDLAAEDSPPRRADFYRILLRSVLILPTNVPLSDVTERRTLPADTQINLMAFQNDAGAVMIPAFSDTEAVLAWKSEGVPFVALRAPDFFRLLAQQPHAEALLNLAGPVRVHLTRAEIEALAQSQLPPPRATREAIPAGSRLLVSAPEQPLEADLRTALQQSLRARPEILAAYHFQLRRDEAAGRDVIGLQCVETLAAETRQAVMQAWLAEMGVWLGRAPLPEFLLLEDPAFIQIVRDTVAPLYAA